MAEQRESVGTDEGHPRSLPPLVGHDKAEAKLARAAASGKLHHAWLISGPLGVGKATLAYRMAAHVLSGARGTEHLIASPDSQTGRWIAAQSHPDLFVLERAFDAKTKRFKSEISVDDARRLLDFFGKTSGSAQWRVAIIDPADDLNAASANALLKMIEEPPKQSLLLLVTNYPGRLLATLKSRCSALHLEPLTQDQVLTIAGRSAVDLSGVSEAEMASALQLSGGCPGAFLGLVSSEGYKAFLALQTAPSLTPQVILDVASRMSQKNLRPEEFDIFTDLVLRWVSSAARDQALNGRRSGLPEAFAAIELSLRDTNALNLDKRQTVTGALAILDKALRTG